MSKEPKIAQPTAEEQRGYQSVLDNSPTVVKIPYTNKKYKIHWLRHCQTRKLSRLLLHKQVTENKDEAIQTWSKSKEVIEDSKLACKASAIFILDGMFKLNFFYWFLWRWFYYVKQYNYEQMSPILITGKKKVPLMQYFKTTTLLIGVKDTLLQMTTREVEHILQELGTEQHIQQPNTKNGSLKQDTSSSGLSQ